MNKWFTATTPLTTETQHSIKLNSTVAVRHYTDKGYCKIGLVKLDTRAIVAKWRHFIFHEQSEVSMFLITPIKMSGYTTAQSLSVKHIWNRYHKQICIHEGEGKCIQLPANWYHTSAINISNSSQSTTVFFHALRKYGCQIRFVNIPAGLSTAGADPASKFRVVRAISVIFGIQVSSRVHYCIREMKYTSQDCCDKTMDGQIALYHECCFPNCRKSWWKSDFFK